VRRFSGVTVTALAAFAALVVSPARLFELKVAETEAKSKFAGFGRHALVERSGHPASRNEKRTPGEVRLVKLAGEHLRAKGS
jgi:hypothetical protein